MLIKDHPDREGKRNASYLSLDKQNVEGSVLAIGQSTSETQEGKKKSLSYRSTWEFLQLQV